MLSSCRSMIFVLATLFAATALRSPAQTPEAPAPHLQPSHPAPTTPAAGAANDPALTQARASIQAGDFKAAEATLRVHLQQNVNSAEAHYLLGYVLFRQQRAKESLAEYTHGARFRTPTESDLIVVAFNYVLLKDYTDADTWFTKALSWNPNNANAWYYLGRTKYNENRFQEAIDAFQHCLKLEPRHIKAQDNLGLAYRGLQRDTEAATAFRTAIEWQAGSEKKDAQPYLNLGTLLVEQNQPEEALTYLQQAAVMSPENPKMHEQLGLAYSELNQLEKARAAFEKAVSQAPNVSGLHFKLGQVYQKLGMKEPARAEFARCAQLNAAHSSEETPNPYD